MPELPFPMPHTQRALAESAFLTRDAWVALAHATGTSSRAYVAGLLSPTSVQVPYEGDPLAFAVVNVAPQAQVLEEGHAGYHLPSVIRWGQTPGAHLSKAGVWYIRVPFRHLTPGTGGRQPKMSTPVYRVARALAPGQRMTAGEGRGRAVHARGLTPYQPSYASNVRPGYTHAAREEGMRRVPGPHRNHGGSRYMTWRTMTQQSPGWNIPPRAGLHLADQVARQVMPTLTERLTAAAREDVLAELARWFA